MPIVGRTAQECFSVFEEHARKLVAATVSNRHFLAGVRVQDSDRMMLSFRNQSPVAVPVKTRYGPLYVYLGQLLEAEKEKGQYRLRTLQYWYRIQTSSSLAEKALLRWEYDTATPVDKFCRHHVQMPAEVSMGDGGVLNLDRVHLATGWVTLEEVIRFLIVELGLKPPCGNSWPGLLRESEQVFFERFTGKRYKVPG